jgi:hypothetical protein
MSRTVKLSEHESRAAIAVGVERQIEAILAGRRSRWPGDGWGQHIPGALAEAAVAKMLGLFPIATPWARRYEGDGAGGYEVRSTSNPRGSLPVNAKDAPDRAFYLAIGQLREWEIFGPMLGRDAMVPRYWREDVPFPAYFVPREIVDRYAAGWEAGKLAE